MARTLPTERSTSVYEDVRNNFDESSSQSTKLHVDVPVVQPAFCSDPLILHIDPFQDEITHVIGLSEAGPVITPEMQEFAFACGLSLMQIDPDFYVVTRIGGGASFLTGQELMSVLSNQPALQMERVQVRHAKARARRLGLPATLTLWQWADTLAHFDYRCVYCGSVDDPTLDHFVPLSLCGPSTVWNCVPACERCNACKGDRHPDDCSFDVWRAAAIHAYLDPLRPVQFKGGDL